MVFAHAFRCAGPILLTITSELQTALRKGRVEQLHCGMQVMTAFSVTLTPSMAEFKNLPDPADRT